MTNSYHSHRLLILTQKVDKEDPVLGFFHNWLEKLSFQFENITVICLQKGSFDLPENVKVFSLGKEEYSRHSYVIRILVSLVRFYKHTWRERKNYDSVLVHMNQEYVLLGGMFWKISGKKIYLWRNHKHGNVLTRIAVWLSDKVFYTSSDSFTARYGKAMKMPVGINIERFKDLKIERLKNSILFLSRMSPVKKPEVLIEALKILKEKNQDFVCNLYGDALPKDEKYYESLKSRVRGYGLEDRVKFYPAVPNYETPKIYQSHEIFVNLTPSGSFDKTILEAAACGCLLVAANTSLKGEIDDRMIAGDSAGDITDKIDFWLNKEIEEKEKTSQRLQKYIVQNHSLEILVSKLAGEMSP